MAPVQEALMAHVRLCRRHRPKNLKIEIYIDWTQCRSQGRLCCRRRSLWWGSASEAAMTEPTAAIAEPPQIAVPTEISMLFFWSCVSRRPNHPPSSSVAPMVAAANIEPLNPRRRTTGRFMPKPGDTTQTCSSHFASFFHKPEPSSPVSRRSPSRQHESQRRDNLRQPTGSLNTNRRTGGRPRCSVTGPL